jgi:metal-dependent amidase/aminoacylase/carboxypeptidase family protein
MPRSTDREASASAAREASASAAREASASAAREEALGGVTPAAPAELLGRLLAAIERELPDALALRHALHEHPELAHAEEATAATVASALPVSCTAVAGTGRVAIVGAGRPADAAVAVRAELDGLPIAERTGAPFSARGAAMHACGHDVHMAALVALARAAHTLGEQLPAPLLAVFQPSEEAYPSGAAELACGSAVPTGRVEHAARSAPAGTGRARPEPERAKAERGALAELAPAAVVAAHVHPELPWGAVALDEGAVNASCDAVEILVEGRPTHGAYPHRGRDPILALAQIVVALHAEVGRRIDPLHAGTLTVGVLEGGGAENVIPALARARGALRAHLPEDRLALRALVEEVAAGVAAAHGCRARVLLTPGEPPLVNDPGIVVRARELLAGAGFERAPEWRSCGSDDFAFFAALAPIAMAFVGLDGAPGFTSRPLHHPELLVPDDAVRAVARAQALLYVAAATLV